MSDNDINLFVSIDDFIENVCLGDYCFLCGKEKKSNEINKEHIIPYWILSRFKLHNKKITLPNKTKITYDKYVVPCCKSCNSLLGEELETPLGLAFSNGFNGIKAFIKENGELKLFTWLCLIFTKTHIKDESLRMFRDRRLSNESIAAGNNYDWESFHHTYCLARSPLTKPIINENSLGSLVIVPLITEGARESFDFIDLTNALTIGVVIGDTGIIAVFGDAHSTLDMLKENIIDKLNGSLSQPQFRELVAHFACCHLHLKESPKFMTLRNPVDDKEPPVIWGFPPKSFPDFEEYCPEIFGAIMDLLLGDIMERNVSIPNYREQLIKGKVSFIFDNDGEFIKNDA